MIDLFSLKPSTVSLGWGPVLSVSRHVETVIVAQSGHADRGACMWLSAGSSWSYEFTSSQVTGEFLCISFDHFLRLENVHLFLTWLLHKQWHRSVTSVSILSTVFNVKWLICFINYCLSFSFFLCVVSPSFTSNTEKRERKNERRERERYNSLAAG